MAITIKKVSTKRELKKFIRFNYRMYKGNPYSVPDLYDDMLNTFNKKKNAAFEFCEADYFLAYRDDKIVGRVAAIINNRANEKWECKNVRFGWIDFIDDPEVSSALIKTVEDWGKERGMTHITGPLGFTDFDAEGMLIEGFDQLSTMATIYNHPYYPVHMERLGFEKDADWVEYKIYIPDAIPDKHKRISELIQRKYNLKIKKYTSGRKIAKDYGQEIFELMNEAYSPLYGYSPLTQRQINQYVKMYLPILDLRMVTLITDTVQSDAFLKCLAVVFTTRVQYAYGFYQLSLRDASSVVAYADAEVLFNGNFDFLTGLHFELVDTVVNDFFEEDIDSVFGVRAIAQPTDVHTGACAHMFHVAQVADVVVSVLYCIVVVYRYQFVLFHSCYLISLVNARRRLCCLVSK
jgi:hypothetical protein